MTVPEKKLFRILYIFGLPEEQYVLEAEDEKLGSGNSLQNRISAVLPLPPSPPPPCDKRNKVVLVA